MPNSTQRRPPQVRLALPSEAADIAALQRRCWDQDQSPRWREFLLTEFSVDQLVPVWRKSVTSPPDARCRVLVALAGTDSDEPPRLVGFATTQPSEDPDGDPSGDGELGEWLIDPPARGQGHGSRLLNAAVDTLRADGFAFVTTWVDSTDDGRRRLLSESGWESDGGHRELGPSENLTVKQVRLHTAVGEE